MIFSEELLYSRMYFGIRSQLKTPDPSLICIADSGQLTDLLKLASACSTES